MKMWSVSISGNLHNLCINIHGAYVLYLTIDVSEYFVQIDVSEYFVQIDHIDTWVTRGVNV
jgi:hypothetical protein